MVSGSSAEVASSESSTFGSPASARAMPTRCFWPPESCAGYALARSREPDQVEQFGDPFGALGRRGMPMTSRGNATLPATVREESSAKCWWIIPIRCRAVRRPVSLSVREVDAVDGDRPGVRPFEHVDAAQQRALARAAAAEHAEDLTRADGQVDAGHRGDVAATASVRLAQTVDADHGASPS